LPLDKNECPALVPSNGTPQVPLHYSVSIDAPAFGVFTIRLLCIRRIHQVCSQRCGKMYLGSSNAPGIFRNGPRSLTMSASQLVCAAPKSACGISRSNIGGGGGEIVFAPPQPTPRYVKVILTINQVGGSGGTGTPTQKRLACGRSVINHATPNFSPTSLTYRYLLADLGPDVPPYVSPWSCWDMADGIDSYRPLVFVHRAGFCGFLPV
jgi:hypothetical protein